MFGKLLPNETIFFDFFEEQARLIALAAQELRASMNENSFRSPESNYIKDLEHQADEITHRCIETLHKSFITPLQPDDIFRLITKMDDIMDSINRTFEDCLIYRITTFTSSAKEMANLLVLATEKLEMMVKGLRDRKNQRIQIRESNYQIHLLENKGDEVLRTALAELFEKEEDLRLVIKWKGIYEVLEQGIDYCEDVSNIIEGFIMEYD